MEQGMSEGKPITTEEGIFSLISNTGCQDAVAALAEAGIDQLVADGFLRDIPVIGSVIGVLRAAGGIRDLLLAKKLGRFLQVFQEIPVQERDEYSERLNDPSDRQRLGEMILLILDRLDDMEKPDLVAKIFRSFLLGEIDLRMFRLLAGAIDRLPIQYLPDLLSFYSDTSNPARIDPEIAQLFSNAGLAQAAVTPGVDLGGISTSSIYFNKNKPGEELARVISCYA
jgi:hypothetical protein